MYLPLICNFFIQHSAFCFTQAFVYKKKKIIMAVLTEKFTFLIILEQTEILKLINYELNREIQRKRL